MASITVPNLDKTLEHRLRIRAARNERSMEEEAREILRVALNGDTALPDPPQNLAKAIMSRFQPLGGVELELPPRGPMREPPRFD